MSCPGESSGNAARSVRRAAAAASITRRYPRSARASRSARRCARPSARSGRRAARAAGTAGGRARPRAGPATAASGRRPRRRAAGRRARARARRCAHSSGVERSCVPASSSVGTSGRSAGGSGARTGVGGQARHCCATPFPLAVARSNGPGSTCAAARRSFAARPASGAEASPHGAATSAHSVLACRPWLSAGAGKSWTASRVAATIRSSGPVSPVRGGRERAPDAVEARPPDRVRGDRVEQVGAVVLARDDGPEVARRRCGRARAPWPASGPPTSSSARRAGRPSRARAGRRGRGGRVRSARRRRCRTRCRRARSGRRRAPGAAARGRPPCRSW